MDGIDGENVILFTCVCICHEVMCVQHQVYCFEADVFFDTHQIPHHPEKESAHKQYYYHSWVTMTIFFGLESPIKTGVVAWIWG